MRERFTHMGDPEMGGMMHPFSPHARDPETAQAKQAQALSTVSNCQSPLGKTIGAPVVHALLAWLGGSVLLLNAVPGGCVPNHMPLNQPSSGRGAGQGEG